MKQYTTFAVFAILVVLAIPLKVSAAEITPNPSTYQYGSTSEYSTGTQVQASSGGTLADTGDAQSVVNFIATILVIAGLGGVFIARKKYA